ncbi:MAG: hypothetical protein ACYCST_19755 [Acidimicrobiales bacterium]
MVSDSGSPSRRSRDILTTSGRGRRRVLLGRLITNHHRVGHLLGRELEGWYSAQIGACRGIFWIDEDEFVVYAGRFDRRSDFCRPK